MPFIPIKRDRTSKPPVGTPLRSDGHWSVQGLVGLFGSNDTASAPMFNDQRPIERVSGSLTPDGIAFSGSQYYDYNTLQLSMPFTVFAVASVTSTSIDGSIFSLSLSSAWDNYYEVGFGASGVIRAITRNPDYIDSTIPNIEVNKLIPIAAVFRNSTYRSVYANGVKGTPSTLSSSPSGFDKISIGSLMRATRSDFHSGTVALCSIYNRELSDDEIKNLSDNPWQVFEPETVWINVAASTLNQHSFRFFNDDGSESAATAKAALNTNITLSPSDVARIRFLIDATGDPTGRNFQLEYRKKPSGGSFGTWTEVT